MGSLSRSTTALASVAHIASSRPVLVLGLLHLVAGRSPVAMPSPWYVEPWLPAALHRDLTCLASLLASCLQTLQVGGAGLALVGGAGLALAASDEQEAEASSGTLHAPAYPWSHNAYTGAYDHGR